MAWVLETVHFVLLEWYLAYIMFSDSCQCSVFTLAFSVLPAGSILEHLATCLIYPNESIKAAVCYLYGKLYSAPNAAERLCVHFTDRLCSLFLTTLKNAQTKELQLNCMGNMPVQNNIKGRALGIITRFCKEFCYFWNVSLVRFCNFIKSERTPYFKKCVL